MPAKTKILVAVHGIGDQVGYETVSSVAGRVGSYLGIAPAVPIGRFYPAGTDPTVKVSAGPALMMSPPDPSALVGFGFAEVYWAEIARTPVKAGHVLQEAKKWARTITGRVSLRAVESGSALPVREQTRIVTVLDELIQTIYVLERLSLVLEKAGLFKFNLRSLLVDFVGDVQLVADFAGYRSPILKEFNAVMKKASDLTKESELYIVAHSEGTVVTLLGLLNALAKPDESLWIHKVKGLMTIGSPIEVHHLLWPELWSRPPAGQELTPHSSLKQMVIPWHNYFDEGDPIAYELTETKRWLDETSGFGKHLTPITHRFSRAYLPGKAHVDYWEDDHVFGHFLETVVDPQIPRRSVTASEDEAAAKKRFPNPPPTKKLAIFTSYLIPNLLVALLPVAATYLLYRPVSGILTTYRLPSATVIRDVLGIGGLLLGITAASRLPRLTHVWKWWAVGALALFLSMVWFSNVTCPASRAALYPGSWGSPAPSSDGNGILGLNRFGLTVPECEGARKPTAEEDEPVLDKAAADKAAADKAAAAKAAADKAAADRPLMHARARWITHALLTVALVLALLTGVSASWAPSWGVRLLPIGGSVVAAYLVYAIVRSEHSERDLWPVILGLAGFFYLWWLGALLFDLVFVWQRYIRHSAVATRLVELSRHGYSDTKTKKASPTKPSKPNGAA